MGKDKNMKNTTSRQDRVFAELLKDNFDFYHDCGWVLDWVTDNFEPEDIFDLSVLDDWALDHGYVKEE